jgi:hypothetical protein
MSDPVIIAAMVCATIIVLGWIGRDKKGGHNNGNN